MQREWLDGVFIKTCRRAQQCINTVKAYEEVIDFIAAGTGPDSIIRFFPSDSVKERVAALLSREKTEGLLEDEKSNLYMQWEHIMRLAKARDRKSDIFNT